MSDVPPNDVPPHDEWTGTNWAGNVRFGSADVVEPGSVDELASAVAAAVRAGRRVRPVGTGHSFSAVADTDGTLVRTGRLRAIGPIGEDASTGATTVTIEAGVRFADLGGWLHERGWALHNLPSLPHITVAGAVATATHGSGSGNTNLAGAVSAVDLVGADGRIRRVGRDDEDLDAAVVGVGAFGPVARLVLDVVPTFEVAQRVWTGLSWPTALAHLDELLDHAYSVSCFTRWGDEVEQLWVKQRVGDVVPFDPGELGAHPSPHQVHPVDGDPMACTDQSGAPGPWHERLPHFRPGFVPSSGSELQTEYFVARSDAVGAIEAVRSIADELDPVLLVSEVRSVAPDTAWWSTAFARPTLALHFTWRLDPAGVAAVLPQLEARLAPFAPLPHWGKLSTIDPETIRSRMPRFDDAEAVRRRFDPGDRFGGPPA